MGFLNPIFMLLDLLLVLLALVRDLLLLVNKRAPYKFSILF